MYQNLPKPNKLIAIYARVSTSNQEEEGTIANQLVALKEFAAQNGGTIVQQYIDDGWSGDSLVRPALDQLRVDVKKKIWDSVLVYDPDRLARRYSYQELVMDELREAGVEVMFVTTPPVKDSSDKLLYGVKGLFAEYERTKITERFRLGKLRKVKEGHILTTGPLYGYRYIKKDKEKGILHGYYEVDEEEARVIRMVFEWVVYDRLTMREVVKKLHKLGIAPRKSKRGVWATSTLTTLLRHKAYIGQAHWGSSYAVVAENPTNKEKYRKVKKTSRKIRPEDEWYMIPVPRIVDDELFMRARVQLDANYKLCVRNKKNQYLLGGKIFCVCGGKRCGEGPQNGKYLYYRCSNKVKTFPLPATCKEKGINAKIADKLVWNKIVGLMSNPELMEKQIQRWIKSKQNKGDLSLKDMEVLKKELGKLKQQEERYNKAYGVQVISLEQLKELVFPIRERIKGIELEIRKVQDGENARGIWSLPNQKEIETFARESEEALKTLNFEEKRGIVMNVVDKIVGTIETLQVFGYLPISNYVEYKTKYRNCWATERGKIHAF